ncbi:MAG: FAD-dependent oxidoreductase [Nitrospirae bacterium]|nr:FAD-dependent oxidoreductase [Nitrospirota bacterium]
MSEDGTYDVLIVGGGPAGLTAAQYAARAHLKTAILDKSPSAGALAIADRIENYPGLKEPVSGKELLDIFREQAIRFGAEYIETQVIGVNLDKDIKEIYTMERTFLGKSVILATGAMGRKPTVKGEKEFLGKGVSYCAICDAAFFRDKTVCVLGDSEEALKEAELLTRFADTVYLIAPSKSLKLPPGHPLPQNDKLKIMTAHAVLSIEGGEVVEKIRLLDRNSDEEKEMPMDGVFVYLHGNRPVVDFLNFSVDISDEECIITNRMMETNLPGVFAAGDVTCVEVRQVVIAAANGCVAALSADKYVHHRKRRRYDWSKSKP